MLHTNIDFEGTWFVNLTNSNQELVYENKVFSVEISWHACPKVR